MEKIIYNTKLKKTIIATFIVMLVLNFIMPNIVNAKEGGLGVNDSYWHDIPWGKPKEEWKNIYLDDMNDSLYKQVKYDEKKIDDKAIPLATDYTKDPPIINMVKYEAYKAAMEAFNSGVDTELAAGKSLYDAVLIASKQAGDAAGEVEENYTADPSETADLGGILLSPIFWLVNFVADAIESNLGRIMMGNGLTLTGGTKLLQGDPIPISSDPEPISVNTNSFVLGSIQYPNIEYTPEEIFSGKIDLLSIDFISGKNYEGVQNEDSGWNGIRTVISQWYGILRMIAIIGLLSVLIYTGIKIIISSNAKDKAKYKEWIINWFMAVAILFAMHYIMAFIISITGEFSKLIAESSQQINVTPSPYGESFSTNLMGLVRFMIQSENFYIKIGYEVMYIALIVYTIKFTVIYLKRVLNMAFLTLIAPIVALTYPIDKINDGRAQGFDMWLKEYVFNALLQPMHQVMYYVLVGSAVSVAAKNPIYGIVVLAFMTEAEKLLKKIFGFDKASGGTVGGMTSAFAAGAIASNIAKMAKLPKGNASKGGAGGDNSAIDAPKPTDKPGMDAFNGVNNETDSRIDIGGNSTESNDNQGTAQQRMLDAYDEEKFGTNEYDSSERESMAREAYQPEGMDLNEQQQREYLRQQGWSEEELNDTFGTHGNNTTNEQPENETRENSTSSTNPADSTPSSTNSTPEPTQNNRGLPIRKVAEKVKNSKQLKGAKAVGKRLLKPAWDLDKSAGYNFTRLAKGAGRAAVGFSIGTAAAAVQAGISITDGKYNPMEGMASFAAGYAGGGQITKGIGSLYDTYKEATLPDDAKERKEKVMERAKARFGDRDDVIAFNKKNYPGQEKEVMERQRDHYLTAGVTDLKEMKAGIKYADALVGKTDGLSAEQIKAKRKEADRKAAATIDFRKTLQEQGQLQAVYDKDKQQKYIQTMVDKANATDKAKVKRQYENAFKSVAAYDAANS